MPARYEFDHSTFDTKTNTHPVNSARVIESEKGEDENNDTIENEYGGVLKPNPGFTMT
jgi:hypothetical protein